MSARAGPVFSEIGGIDDGCRDGFTRMRQFGADQSKHWLAELTGGKQRQMVSNFGNDIPAIGKRAKDQAIAASHLSEWRRIDFLHVLYEEIIAYDLRVKAADAGKGSNGLRSAIEGHAQGANVGDEDRPLFLAGQSLARHVVDHDAKQNRDADFGGKDKFGHDASPAHISARHFVSCTQSGYGWFDGGVLIQLAHLSPPLHGNLLPCLGNLRRSNGQRIEE